jgi:hypothetical protein
MIDDIRLRPLPELYTFRSFNLEGWICIQFFNDLLRDESKWVLVDAKLGFEAQGKLHSELKELGFSELFEPFALEIFLYSCVDYIEFKNVI